MNRITFYERIPDMVCLAGDTLPTFVVTVDLDEGETLDGCSMQLIVNDYQDHSTAVLCRDCTALPDGTGFAYTLTSSDTAGLSGVFELHFRLIDADGLSQRKLYGILTVNPCPQGGSTS